MTTRAAELARKAGWKRWLPAWDVDPADLSDTEHLPYIRVEDKWVPLDPEHNFDHALALAECRWPKEDGWWFTMTLNLWHPAEARQTFEAQCEHARTMRGEGETLALAICAALDAAGEKDASG